MGGHGGLNILPQKKWNVYNYDNRDIVEKDKKLHAEKMKAKYENERKSALENKFEILKSESGNGSVREEQFINNVKRDSILNNEFKRLAQQNQHVNLFEREQKILENRQVMEYKRLREGEFMKEKGLDYSSKFLGAYTDEGKVPWYAKNKAGSKSKIMSGGESGNGYIGSSNNRLSRQRYDMEDLVDELMREKDKNNYRVKEREEIKEERKRQEIRWGGREEGNYEGKREEMGVSDERERSRDRKYEFVKGIEEKVRAEKIGEVKMMKPWQSTVQVKQQYVEVDETKPHLNREKHQGQIMTKLPQKQLNNRQQRQGKKITQLKLKPKQPSSSVSTHRHY